MNATTITTPIIITGKALEELQLLIDQQETQPNKHLRIGVKGGGCSGFSYILELDEKTDSDNSYEQNGVEFIVNKAQELYLTGTILDFKGGLDNRGFVFENPNAASTCGCGTSFSV